MLLFRVIPAICGVVLGSCAQSNGGTMYVHVLCVILTTNTKCCLRVMTSTTMNTYCMFTVSFQQLASTTKHAIVSLHNNAYLPKACRT